MEHEPAHLIYYLYCDDHGNLGETDDLETVAMIRENHEDWGESFGWDCWVDITTIRRPLDE